MKKIAVFTTTRAEFGILSALLKEIGLSKQLQALLFVGGSHLTPETGNTINEINKSEFKITATFDYLLNSDKASKIAESLGIAVVKLSNIFATYKFDLVCVLGDRYELLAIVSNAIIFKKPIIHLHGGEITEGAIDEQIRHMVTKASHIHCAACEEYAQNIINMGEEKWRVHNVGALSVDNIKSIPKLPKYKLFKTLNLDPNKDTILLTYHPVTLEFNISPIQQIKNLFEALNNYQYQIVITAPNVDNDRDQINKYLKDQVNQKKDYHYFESLGFINYLNLIPQCKFVIGNSSSGIIEVPYFKIPTINIGNRQKGRIMHESIINTDYYTKSIIEAINNTKDQNFLNKLSNQHYKFGDGNASKKIVDILINTDINDKLLKKELDFKN